MICSRGLTKTILLKSPDSEKVREVIVTSVLLPKSENENNRILFKTCRNSEDLGLVMEKRMCKRRLDHLTLEEKILRKKLKNREAAQTSRDRKKARLEELETSVARLECENEALHEEVRSLKDDKETLIRENARLSEEVWKLSVAGSTSGPAVSCPLPQGVSLPPALFLTFLLLRHLLPAFLLSILMTGPGSMTSPLLLSLKNWNSLQILFFLKLVIQKKKNCRKMIWWGRRQKAWNPVGHVWKIRKRT